MKCQHPVGAAVEAVAAVVSSPLHLPLAEVRTRKPLGADAKGQFQPELHHLQIGLEDQWEVEVGKHIEGVVYSKEDSKAGKDMVLVEALWFVVDK